MNYDVTSTATQAARPSQGQLLPPLPPAPVEPVAYSAEPEPGAAQRATARRVAALLTAILATSSGIAAAILLLGHHRAPPPPPPVAEPAPALYVPKLNGTYRIDYDWAHPTYRNAKLDNGDTFTWEDPPADAPPSSWWAFSSFCTPTGCIANGVGLETEDHQKVIPDYVIVMRLVDGVWRDITPDRAQSECAQTRDDGKVLPTGKAWLAVSWDLALLPNGTFRGSRTATIETDECNSQGNTILTPITATRIGDVPSGVLFDAKSPPPSGG